MLRVSNKHTHHGIKIKQVLYSPTKFLSYLCEDLSKLTQLLILHERAISLSKQKIHALNKLIYLYPVARESNSEVGWQLVEHIKMLRKTKIEKEIRDSEDVLT